jgi:TubC N-terminal docking domain
MTQAAEILTELRGRGVSVTVEGDVLCLKPRRALDDALLARVRDSKPGILAVLRNLTSNCAAVPVQILGTGTCWHCGGLRTCNCSACGVMRAAVEWTAGECVACKSKKSRVQ